jgi:hypothetical protein
MFGTVSFEKLETFCEAKFVLHRRGNYHPTALPSITATKYNFLQNFREL